MSQTPIATPGRTNGKGNRKLPLIVDIAIDGNGQQVYQVHESSKLVRKEMPKSTNFTNSNEEEKTPIRKVLGTLSPSTLSQKKIQDDNEEIEEPESATRRTGNLNIFTGNISDNCSSNEPNSNSGTNPKSQDNDIWSEDVEQAFEEIIRIIPKNGLNKIKISGRSCGRNELISDYILTKTGKFRSRKQVSSHIQVIKNLGQKLDIIKLINDGPVFDNEDDQIKNAKKFEEIFSKINLNKSLGLNESCKRKSSLPSITPPSKKLKSSEILIENFFISVHVSNSLNPIILTVQSNNDEIKTLKLKEDANISSRFPGLNDFQNSHIPVIHNMVKMQLPILPYNYSIENGLKSNYYFKCNNNNLNKSYSVFTCIYSFGNEVLKLTDENIKLNENRSFLLKFWKLFLSKLIEKDSMESNLAFKGITIKQIIYENSSNSSILNSNSNLVSKSKVKLLLLWEFAKVDHFKDAITTTTKLTLPNKIFSNTNIIPQIISYQPSQSQVRPQELSSSASQSLNSQFNSTTSQALPTITTAGTILDPNWNNDKPQSNIQRKFQSLQQQQHAQLQKSQPFQRVSLQSTSNQQLNPSATMDLMSVSNEPQDYQFGGLLYPDTFIYEFN